MTDRFVVGGGCFWGLQDLLRSQPGVVSSRVGYAGGPGARPTYASHAGHAEAVEVEYDPNQTSYRKLLDFFFSIHNPTTKNRQGNDVGTSYRSVIFYDNPLQKQLAAAFIELVNDSGRWPDPVVTELEPLANFYTAESEHQDYLVKHPGGYTCHYIRFGGYIAAED